MIKKIFTVVLASFLISVPVFAHDGDVHTTDDASIEKRLQEQGLDKAPGVVEVPKSEMQGEKPSSGFVDENGRPLSDEEYNKIREEQSKGIFQKYPWIIPVVLVLAVGGIAIVFKLKKPKSQNN